MKQKAETAHPKPVKIYIAGSFLERDKIRRLMDRAEGMGHKITSDWTAHKPISPYEKNIQMARQYVSEDLIGASVCDVFILIPDSEGGTTQFAELGAAITSKIVKKIFVVGPHNKRSLAFFHPKVERTVSMKEVFSRI